MRRATSAHAGFKILPKLELMTVLGDLHLAKLARPFIDILKEVPVNGAKVRQVKASRGDTLSGALNDKKPLNLLQPFLVGDAEFVSEDRGTGIEV